MQSKFGQTLILRGKVLQPKDLQAKYCCDAQVGFSYPLVNTRSLPEICQRAKSSSAPERKGAGTPIPPLTTADNRTGDESERTQDTEGCDVDGVWRIERDYAYV